MMKVITSDENGSHNHAQKIEKNRFSSLLSFLSNVKEIRCNSDTRNVIHSIKVGIALVLVSLLYLLDPLFTQVGQNSMWAIMTVVVMFEFYAGATLSKGINRGIGTLLGGACGCLAAILADVFGGIGNPITVACSVFAFSGAATYCRRVPWIKKSCDYGIMISILTFNLIAVSGVRADKVLDMAVQRLANISMGFAVCIFVNFLVFPMWASDEIHSSTSSKFLKLATSIEGCFDEYFKIANGKENETSIVKSDAIKICKSVLNSKSNDETLANFAKWEPWHGKFGISYPWKNYLEVGESLRELAATVISLRGCLQSSMQPLPIQREVMKEPCEIFLLYIVWTLRELGESIENMEKCEANVLLSPKLKSMKLQLTPLYLSPDMENDENHAITSFSFLLMEIVDKVEILAGKVQELGEFANFEARQHDV